MEPCLFGVEFKTYGRIAPVGQENEENSIKTGQNRPKSPKNGVFKKSWAEMGGSPKPKPTGC